MRLLKVSDGASAIGDNRAGIEIDRELLELYREYFSDTNWGIILESIVDRLLNSNLDIFSSSGSDIVIYTLHFLMCHSPESIRCAFNELCNTHMMFITSKKNSVYDRYELNVNSSVSTLKDLVEFQIGYEDGK